MVDRRIGSDVSSLLDSLAVSDEELERAGESIPAELLLWVMDEVQEVLNLLAGGIYEDLEKYRDLDAYSELTDLRARLTGADGLSRTVSGLLEELSSTANIHAYDDSLERVRRRATATVRSASRFADRTFAVLRQAGVQARRLFRRHRDVLIATRDGITGFARDIAASKHARTAIKALIGIMVVGAAISLPFDPAISGALGTVGTAADWITSILSESESETSTASSSFVGSSFSVRSIGDELAHLKLLFELGTLTSDEFGEAKRLVLRMESI